MEEILFWFLSKSWASLRAVNPSFGYCVVYQVAREEMLLFPQKKECEFHPLEAER